MRVRVELGPRDAAAGQCVLATHDGPPGQPAAKRVVAAGPALAAAARAALGLQLAQDEYAWDEGGVLNGAAPSPAAGQGEGGGVGGEGAPGSARIPKQGGPGRLRAGADERIGDGPIAGAEGGSGKVKKKEKGNMRDTQAPAAGADAGLKPERAAAAPAAGRMQQPNGAHLGSYVSVEVLGTVQGARRKERLKREEPGAGIASAAPGMGRAAGDAARAKLRKLQLLSGDDLGEDFAIEVVEDDGGARKGKRKKKRMLEAPQAAGGELRLAKKTAAKLVKF